jgi:hypothetical protein
LLQQKVEGVSEKLRNRSKYILCQAFPNRQKGPEKSGATFTKFNANIQQYGRK